MPAHMPAGTFASASAAELKIASQLAKDPWGRFGGKEGKQARIRQQEAAHAAAARVKLGLDPPPGPKAGPATSSAAAAAGKL